jgi:hypothetical protein
MSKKYFVMVLTMLWSVPAFAAHPLITDDTGTQGKGKFQLELNGEYVKNEENNAGITEKETGGTIAAALTYGIDDNVDIIVGFPWQWSTLRENGSMMSNDKGIGDTSIDIKWRLLESKAHELSLALKPGITIPTGDEAKGFGNGKISEGMMLIVTREWQHGVLHCNVGYTHHNYEEELESEIMKKDIWHASLATELNMADNLRAVGDIGIETNQDDTSDTHPVFLLGGIIYSATENLDLDFGVKGGLNKAETDTIILAGFSVKF